MTAHEPRFRQPGLARAVALFGYLLVATTVSAQETATFVGRVLDEESLAPIPEVLVRIDGGPLSTLTDIDGRFRIAQVPAGTRVVFFQHLAYGDHHRPLFVQAGDSLNVNLRLARQAIALPAMTVVGLTELEQRRVSTGHAMNEIHRPAIEQAAVQGHSLGELLAREMSSVSVRHGSTGANSCVEYRGSVGTDDELCRDVAVYLDGVPVTVPAALFPNMPLRDIERLEVLSPGQAGAIYGIEGGRGVLLIETRRGIRPQGPARPREDLVTGFDWSEETQAYDWLKVAGGSMLGNAIGLGVAMLAADRCFRVFRVAERDPNRQVLGIDSRCNSVMTVAAGFAMLELPGLGGSLGARWGGGTERSRGRVLPGLILGTVSSALGYMLVVQGGARDSDAAVAAGTLVLTVGTPALLVLADRGFRVLRR